MGSTLLCVRNNIRQRQIAVGEDVIGLRGAILRQERAVAGIKVDIDQIKIRLDLSD